VQNAATNGRPEKKNLKVVHAVKDMTGKPKSGKRWKEEVETLNV